MVYVVKKKKKKKRSLQGTVALPKDTTKKVFWQLYSSFFFLSKEIWQRSACYAFIRAVC